MSVLSGDIYATVGAAHKDGKAMAMVTLEDIKEQGRRLDRIEGRQVDTNLFILESIFSVTQNSLFGA